MHVQKQQPLVNGGAKLFHKVGRFHYPSKSSSCLHHREVVWGCILHLPARDCTFRPGKDSWEYKFVTNTRDILSVEDPPYTLPLWGVTVAKNRFRKKKIVANNPFNFNACFFLIVFVIYISCFCPVHCLAPSSYLLTIYITLFEWKTSQMQSTRIPDA